MDEVGENMDYYTGNPFGGAYILLLLLLSKPHK